MKVKKSLRSCIMALVLCLSLGMSALAYESVTCKSQTTRVQLSGTKKIGDGNGAVYMGGTMNYYTKAFSFTGTTWGCYTAGCFSTMLKIHCTKNGTGKIVFDCSSGTQSINGNKGTISWEGVKSVFGANFMVKSEGSITQLNVYCSAYIVTPLGGGTVYSGDYLS